jgi:hypothetical protein
LLEIVIVLNDESCQTPQHYSRIANGTTGGDFATIGTAAHDHGIDILGIAETHLDTTQFPVREMLRKVALQTIDTTHIKICDSPPVTDTYNPTTSTMKSKAVTQQYFMMVEKGLPLDRHPRSQICLDLSRYITELMNDGHLIQSHGRLQ